MWHDLAIFLCGIAGTLMLIMAVIFAYTKKSRYQLWEDEHIGKDG